jgi:hypothetical protein
MTASGFSTGVSAPEKKATCNDLPSTNVTIHCVSSLPQSVLRCRNFCAPLMFNR